MESTAAAAGTSNTCGPAYFDKDFVSAVESALKLKDITTAFYRKWQYRFNQVMPTTNEEDPCTEARQECLQDVTDYIKSLRASCRLYTNQRLLDVAGETLNLRRPDGQPIGTWTELRLAIDVLCDTENHGKAFRAIYGRAFGSGWELEQEIRIMRDRGIAYRPWDRKNEKEKKGFVAKLNSLTLNERRKEVKQVKR